MAGVASRGAVLGIVLGMVTAGCGGDGGGGGGGGGGGDRATGGVGGGVADAPASAAPSAEPGDSAPTRAALPGLFGIMLGLQRDMTRIGHGLWVEDYDSIAAAGQAVADHPTIPQDEAQRIAEVLGEDMSGFQRLDREVHDLATRVAEHARAGRLDSVLVADAALREACVACHSRFRARLREGIGTP